MRILTKCSLRHLLVATAASHICAQSVSCFAQSEGLLEIMAAKTPAEFDNRHNGYQSLRQSRLRCDLELKMNSIPVDCFRVLKAEQELGVLTSERRQEHETWLLENCKHVAKAQKDVRGFRAEGLPPDCASIVAARLRDIKYSETIERPHELFETRFNEDPADRLEAIVKSGQAKHATLPNRKFRTK